VTPPFVSFVLPTFRAARFLPACLESIRRQDYPPDRYEILVADGGSDDGTTDVARRFGARLVEAGGLLAEAAKKRAFVAAGGDFLALVDADNELRGTDWLARATAALSRHPEALGFESYYFKHPSDSRLNQYLTGLLQISDPLAAAIAGRPELVSVEADGAQILRLPVDGSYPTGANGFLFRRDLLRELGEEPYHEAAFFPRLIRAGRRILVKIPGCGVYHHYVTTWRDYFRKRQRTMILYLMRKRECPDTWEGERMRPRTALAIAGHATLLWPLAQSIWRALRSRDPDWLLHPAASAVSTAAHVIGVVRYRRTRSRDAAQALSMQLSGPDRGSPAARPPSHRAGRGGAP
jgi:glycosyltransferase involved in cell wall biosynthesis